MVKVCEIYLRFYNFIDWFGNRKVLVAIFNYIKFSLLFRVCIVSLLCLFGFDVEYIGERLGLIRSGFGEKGFVYIICFVFVFREGC